MEVLSNIGEMVSADHEFQTSFEDTACVNTTLPDSIWALPPRKPAISKDSLIPESPVETSD
jgi:hypothetical protein